MKHKVALVLAALMLTACENQQSLNTTRNTVCIDHVLYYNYDRSIAPAFDANTKQVKTC